MATKNEENILQMLTGFEDNSNWCNPFDFHNVPSQLINICTGKIADPETEKSLSNFLETAQNNVNTMLNSLQQKSFWDPIKRNKIPTFTTNLCKSKKV